MFFVPSDAKNMNEMKIVIFGMIKSVKTIFNLDTKENHIFLFYSDKFCNNYMKHFTVINLKLESIL